MKKALKTSGYVLFLLFTVLLLLEVCYRFQLIDFYSTEWKILNKDVKSNHEESKKKS